MSLRNQRCGPGKHRTMWRVALAAAALLGFAISSAEAAHPSRTTCADRDSMFCALYRGNPGHSGHKLSHSPARRLGAKSRNGAESAANIGQARAVNPIGAKPFAGAAQAKLLAVRTFDPLASGSHSCKLTPHPPARTGTPPSPPALPIA